jgi:hypothetical protein
MIIAQVTIAVIGVPATLKMAWDGVQSDLTKANYSEESFLAAILSADADAPAGIAASDYARESESRFGRLTTKLVADLEAEAAVADVTVASNVPGTETRAHIVIHGAGGSPSGSIESRSNQVASDFFDAFGARVIAGRALRDSDSSGSTQAVVVNRAFVNQFLGGANAVGLRLHYATRGRRDLLTGASPMKYEIVGVVTDLTANKIAPDLIDPVIYQGLRNSASATLLIRMRGNDPSQFSSRFRDLTAALDPTLRLRIVTFGEMKRQQMLALRLMLFGCSLVVVTVLLLSAAGIYAMMSFTVSQRRKEIGIRAAMGADAAQILRSIFTKAALQLTAGVAFGILLALMADWASDGEFLGSVGRALLPVAALLITLVGLFATIGPARTGLLIPPTEALRSE